MQRLNGCGARSLLNGSGAGVGTRRDSTAALHRLDWFFTRRSPAARVLSPPLPPAVRSSIALFIHLPALLPCGAISRFPNPVSLFPSSRSRSIPSSDFPSFTGSPCELLAEQNEGKRENVSGRGRRRGGRGTRARLNIYLNGSAVSWTRLARTPPARYVQAFNTRSLRVRGHTLVRIRAEKRGIGDGRVNRAGGLFRAYVNNMHVRVYVCARTGVDVTSTRERGRRLVWWFSIPFSSRPRCRGWRYCRCLGRPRARSRPPTSSHMIRG